ncbi:MAG: hypothetical protein IAF38_22850, partial [Bacteroidia bacterium]|nr:hypothetical protein [Bacteroidia bacterium]
MAKETKKRTGANEIASVKIYPGIGIARVGNSPDEYFIGPESPWEDPNSSGKFKDALGRVKRQAARFRVYAFDSKGNVIKELTASNCEINWHVKIANKKASYYQFAGRYNQVYTNKNLRNPLTHHSNELVNPDTRAEWIISPQPKSISGVNKPAEVFDDGKIKDKQITLGEIRTDEKGRLLVLGGSGESGSLIPDNYIREYANNANWYDTTSDGTINATVTLPDGTELKADSAWVLVTPPKFAPSTYNLVSLYDRIKERSAKNEKEKTQFYKHIYPVLYRASNYAWVNAMAYRGHGSGKNGNFINPLNIQILSSNKVSIEIPKNPPTAGRKKPETQTVNCKEAREALFKRIRKPLEIKNPDQVFVNDTKVDILNLKEVVKQANYYYMPQLSGDNGDALTYTGPLPKDADPTKYNNRRAELTWLTVTETQYRHLENWAKGDFIEDTPEKFIPLDDYPISEQPAMLDRGVLEPCIGGPFFPGIEMTFLADEPATFRSPFRIAHKFSAGDITRIMALPWQADFFECNTHWWPGQRPDDVVSEDTFEEAKKILANYVLDEKTENDGNVFDQYSTYAGTMSERVMWARGVDDNPADIATGANVPSGDSKMVTYWHELGFITKRLAPAVTFKGEKYRETVYVEQERNPYAGELTDRQLFYMLQNIDDYPHILPKVKDYVERTLAAARAYGNADDSPEQMKYFRYTADFFKGRMMDVYNSLVADEVLYDPATDPIFKDKKSVLTRLITAAPFNMTDGAWLRHIDKCGPTDIVQSL